MSLSCEDGLFCINCFSNPIFGGFVALILLHDHHGCAYCLKHWMVNHTPHGIDGLTKTVPRLVGWVTNASVHVTHYGASGSDLLRAIIHDT